MFINCIYWNGMKRECDSADHALHISQPLMPTGQSYPDTAPATK